MSELEEKLENILGNPQAMAQIMSLAQSLGAGSQNADQPQAPPEQAPPRDPPPQAPEQPALPSAGGLAEMLGGLDPSMLSAAAGLLGQFNSGKDDRRVALLTALRPFVREDRYAKLDQAVQIAKLSRLIRGGLELFRQRREDSHV